MLGKGIVKRLIKLRPYQTESISQIYKEWQYNKSILFQMPTGTGKTIVFTDIVNQESKNGKKILIVAHRQEIIYQIKDKLSQYGIKSGLIMSGHQENRMKQVQVASIQTLNRREHPPADLVIIDEAHHSTANSYKKLWEIYNNHTKFLGVTATPLRLSGESFNDFDVLITSKPIKWFIDKKYLSPYKYYATSFPDISKVKIRHGDYIENELGKIMLEKNIMADLLDSYKKHALNKKTIIFATNILHSNQIVNKYSSEGFKIEHIDGTTPYEKRKEIIHNFKNGETNIISNVGIINKGFDLPICSVVQLARPTKSLTLFLQQVGRCLRYNENKDHAIILDNAGCWIEHGLPSSDRSWSLKNNTTYYPSQQNICAINSRGERKSTNLPQECKNLELVLLENADIVTGESVIMTGCKDATLFPGIEEQYLQKKEEIALWENKLVSVDAIYRKTIENEINNKRNELIILEAQVESRRKRESQSRLQIAVSNITELINDYVNSYNFCDVDEKFNLIKNLRLRLSPDNEFDFFLINKNVADKIDKSIIKTNDHKKNNKERKFPKFTFYDQDYSVPSASGNNFIRLALNILSEYSPDEIETILLGIFNKHKNKRRRKVAKIESDLYSNSARITRYQYEKLNNGWLIDTHNSSEQKIELIRTVLYQLGLEFGKDFIIHQNIDD